MTFDAMFRSLLSRLAQLSLLLLLVLVGSLCVCGTSGRAAVAVLLRRLSDYPLETAGWLTNDGGNTQKQQR